MKQKQEKKNIAEVISLRGTGKIYLPDNVFEFIPTKKGEPLQKDVKKYGVAKAYTTTGKDPKRVITLQCPNDTTDPYATLCSQFKSVMKSEYKKDLPAEILPKGVILANKVHKGDGSLCVLLIHVSTRNWLFHQRLRSASCPEWRGLVPPIRPLTCHSE